MTTQKPLILVDGSSYLYRAFFALPPLTNSKGQATGAIYGVVSMLRKLIREYQPEHIAVVFDAKGKTFRDDLFVQYKAKRPSMPHDLKSQIQPLQQIVAAMGLPMLIIDGVEADDVIATLALQAASQGMSTLISTGDKDITQLVNEKITCINTMSNTLMDREGVINKFGIPPELIVDYLSLVGDKVDNVPGVPSVGPKTAVKWLNEFGSLDNIIANAEKITGKVGENLRSHLTELDLSRQLVILKTDVELDVSPIELNLKEPNKTILQQLYSELEFKTFLTEILEQTASQTSTADYKTILTENELNKLIEEIHAAKYFVFGTETTSLNYINAEVVGISIAIQAHEAFYIPLAHSYIDVPKQLDRTMVLNKLKPILESAKHKIIGENLKYDKGVLKNYGIDLIAIAFDTMLESYILNSSSSRHDIDTLALKYLSHKTIHFEDVAGKGAKQKTFDQIDIAAATEYAAEGADVTLQLHQVFLPKLEEHPSLLKVLQTIEMPLLSILSKMELHGVLIDKNKLAVQSEELAKRIAELEDEVFALAGESFNMNSPKQLLEILFHKLKLPILKKTPTGQASTAEPVLQELALDFPLPKLILEYRSLTKLKSTYADALPEQINAKTGRVHTSYNQAVTATGRLSSTDPNLQNIPIRTIEGRRIRQAFIAPKKHKIVAADYSQIELRIMAHLSGDKGLIDAFAAGLDIHKATAAEVFNIPLEKVAHEQRRSAKAINFGLIYGMSNYGLAKQLNIEPKIAQNYIDLYFHRYPGVKVYMEKTRELAHQQGYVETIFGRRLYLPDINAKNFQLRSAAERAAINAPMQGTAADIIKLAMIAMDNYLNSWQQAKMIMQVHDELVFEVLETHAADFKTKVSELMSNCVSLKVPLVVDAGIGDNWDEAH